MLSCKTILFRCQQLLRIHLMSGSYAITSSTSNHKRIKMSAMEISSDSPKGTFYRKDKFEEDKQSNSKKEKKKKKEKNKPKSQLDITEFFSKTPGRSATNLPTNVTGTCNQFANSAWNKPLPKAASAQPGLDNDANTYPVPARPHDTPCSSDRQVTNEAQKGLDAQQGDNSRSIHTKDQAEETKDDHSRDNSRNTTSKLPIVLSSAESQPSFDYSDADVYPVPPKPQDSLMNKGQKCKINLDCHNPVPQIVQQISSLESEASNQDIIDKDIGDQQSDNYQNIHTKDQSQDPCHPRELSKKAKHSQSREHSKGRDKSPRGLSRDRSDGRKRDHSRDSSKRHDKSPYGHSRERSDDHQEKKRDHSRERSKGLQYRELSYETPTTNTQIESVPAAGDSGQGARPKIVLDQKGNDPIFGSKNKDHNSQRSDNRGGRGGGRGRVNFVQYERGSDNSNWGGGRGRRSNFDKNYGKDERGRHEKQGKRSQPGDQQPQVQEPGRKKAAKATKVDLSAIIYKSGFELHTHYGDLFECSDENSFAHCISADVKMGAGIAVEFRKIFGGVEDLKGQGKTVGQVAILKRQERYIYNLITKEKYNKKPNYNTLKSCLMEMKKHCSDHGVEYLAMPKIGCGLDRLTWPNVEELVCQVFRDMKIKITVCHV